MPTPHPPQRPRRFPCPGAPVHFPATAGSARPLGTGAPLRLVACGLILVMTALLAGCQSDQNAEMDEDPPPPPTYTGPDYLRGSIGSLGRLRGYGPRHVAGYGLVVGLDGTGSRDVPPGLRQWMLDMMTKRGFGRHETGFQDLTPAQVLNSRDTAVVRVDGVIPPGAVRGTRFDLLVSALSQTQTTSLEGGRLYTTNLQLNGPSTRRLSAEPLATGRGPLFQNPLADAAEPTEQLPAFTPAPADQGRAESEGNGASGESDNGGGGDGDAATGSVELPNPEDPRVGRVLAGGVTHQRMPVELVLHRPSYPAVRQIADRINARFPPEPTDEGPIAEPQNPSVIEINVLQRFENNPQHMMDLIAHLFLNPSDSFSQQKAEELARLIQQPEYQDEDARSIAYVWQGLGNRILPVIRPLYSAEHPTAVRLAALEAGVGLRDQRAEQPLIAIAETNLGEPSERATRLLGRLLDERPSDYRLAQKLRQFLSAEDPGVRFAALNALRRQEDGAIRSFAFGDKFALTQAQSDNPMIFVTRAGLPRVVIFGESITFNRPLFLKMWDHRFMLQAGQSDQQISIFYQPENRQNAIRAEIPDDLTYLVGTMGFQPDPESVRDSETPGLDMSYAQVVQVLHKLTDEGHVDAPFILQHDELRRRISDSRENQPRSGPRPETRRDGPAPRLQPEQPDASSTGPAGTANPNRGAEGPEGDFAPVLPEQ